MGQLELAQASTLATVDPVALGSRIRAARISRGLNQSDLTGGSYSVGYISRIESGARRPTLAALTTISEQLGTTVGELVAGASEEELDEIRLGMRYAELALANGEALDAERQARQVLERARSTSLPELAAEVRFVVARALEVRGQLDEAIRELEALLEETEGLLAIRCSIALSRCYREAGDLSLAIEVGERAAPGIAAGGLDRSDEAVQLAMTVALAHIERGDLHRAVRICADAITLAEETASPTARSAAYWNASIAHSERGDTLTALRLADRALALLGEGQDTRNLARLRVELGRLHLALDEPDAGGALKHLLKATAELEGTGGSRIEIAQAEVVLAHALVADGRAEEALVAAESARRRNPAESTLGAAEAGIAHAEALAALGREDEALAVCREAATLMGGLVGADRWVAQAWCELAELFDLLGDGRAMNDALRAAASASGLRLRGRNQARAASSATR